jgi:beta-N-acetylhexosaminidase
MPLAQRIGQKLMAAGRSSQLSSEKAVFDTYQIGGIIMMDEASSDQIAKFRNGLTIPLTVAVDQEGGTVQRYNNANLMPSAEQTASTLSVNAADQQYAADSAYLKSNGITTNFAPVVDVVSRTPSPLPGRMFSADPNIVSDYAAAAAKAMQSEGLTPVVKHFPGLGSGSANTDFSPAVTDPLATLKARDLIPYEKLASLHPDVMVGNMIVPGLTDGQPAIWSPDAITILRGIGYQNSVVYSDSLTAKAVPGDLTEAVIKSWQAGIDVALIVQEEQDTTNLGALFLTINSRVSSALQSGELSEEKFNESVLRILNRKHTHPCELPA